MQGTVQARHSIKQAAFTALNIVNTDRITHLPGFTGITAEPRTLAYFRDICALPRLGIFLHIGDRCCNTRLL